LRMHDPVAVRGRQAADLLRPESLLVELDGLGTGTAHEMRYQALEALGNRFDGRTHGLTPWKKVRGWESRLIVGLLQGADVGFLHLQERAHDTLRFLRIGIAQEFEKHGRDDLPR